MHGGSFGQRQKILRLDPVAARIGEALMDAGFGDESADFVVDIAGQRNEFKRLAVPGRCLDRAKTGFRARRGGEAEEQDCDGEDRAQRLVATFQIGVDFVMVCFHRRLPVGSMPFKRVLRSKSRRHAGRFTITSVDLRAIAFHALRRGHRAA